MVRFSYTRFLCFVARAAILAVIVCFRWYHAGEGPAMKKWEVSLLPELLRGLNGIELLTPDANRAVFHVDHSSQISTVVENRVERINVEDSTYAIGSGTQDFVFVSGDNSGIRFADIALKIGGIAAVQVDLSANEPFRIPPNFQIVYISRLSSTVIAMRKISGAPPTLNVTGKQTEFSQYRRPKRKQ
ncbi:uncharacterized protein LOC110029020 [Phalaenopsis equestris]|uniref:uncharacterized protein LOC110029020 n=1 Tax=Phalaenopsis equestris TaxID=78828 RepID=UPI0009E22558|nr:uncharacterized protein LOC110029020 [Phalaenopsis equestris]